MKKLVLVLLLAITFTSCTHLECYDVVKYDSHGCVVETWVECEEVY